MNGEQVAALLAEARREAEQRRFDEAAQPLEQILDADPVHLKALDLLGYVEYFRGNAAKAEECCRRALAVDPDHVYALKGLGLCLARQGQVADGVVSLKRAIALDPGYPDARWDLAVVYTNDGQHMKAIEVLRQAAMDIPRMMERFTALMKQVEARL